MALTSVISHPQKIPILILRADFIGICKAAPDANCAGAILSILEYWTNIKQGNQSQAQARNIIDISGGEVATQDESLWVYKKQEELYSELFGLFGKNKINDNILWLRNESGFMDTRQNPAHRWDRTLQYQMNIETVQAAIDSWYLRDFKNKVSNDDNQSLESAETKSRQFENKQAIPEITTETSTEKKELPPTPALVEIIDKATTEFDAMKKAVRLLKAYGKDTNRVVKTLLNLHEDEDKNVGGEPVKVEDIPVFIEWYKQECPGYTLPRNSQSCVKWFNLWRDALLEKALVIIPTRPALVPYVQPYPDITPEQRAESIALMKKPDIKRPQPKPIKGLEYELESKPDKTG